MPISLSDPMVFFTNGIPILPADLDIQAVGSKDQINRLAAFSQLVNDIPATNSKVWLPDGTKTWDIYELVLSMAQFPEASSETFRPNSAFVTNTQLPDPQPDWKKAVVGIGNTLRSTGFKFESLAVVPPPAPGPGPKRSVAAAANAPASSLSSQFQTLRANLAAAKLTDLVLGSQFLPTLFSPASFYESGYDSYWQPFEFTPQKDEVWVPVPAGGKITGELTSVLLRRSWWSTWIFANRAWRFSPESGMQPISDGGSPPSGSMPVFPSALLIARNVKTVLPQNPSSAERPINLAAASFTPFTLLSAPRQLQGDDATVSGNSAPAAHAVNPQVVKTLAQPLDPNSAPPMTIFAIVCTPIGVCPNPIPGLNWPA